MSYGKSGFVANSIFEMNQVVTKIFLTREATLETKSHVYSTRDPIDGFLTLQTAHNVLWHKLSIKLKGT